MKKKTSEDRYRVPSLDKALDFLEYLARVSSTVPLSSIARDLNKTAGEVFRVVDCLVKRSYIIKDRTLNAYSLSLKLFELTNGISPVKRIVDASFVPLSRLVREIGFSCHLSVLEGCDLVIVYEQEGLTAVHIHAKAGARIPAVNTSSGRLLLANLEEETFRGALSLDVSFSSLGSAERRGIENDIASLRGRTRAVLKSKQQPGVYDIVALVELYRNRYAALAAPVFQLDYGEKVVLVLADKVLAAAEDIKKNAAAL